VGVALTRTAEAFDQENERGSVSQPELAEEKKGFVTCFTLYSFE
jgi:uncharacterized protein YfiM (DUF2279 family)